MVPSVQFNFKSIIIIYHPVEKNKNEYINCDPQIKLKIIAAFFFVLFIFTTNKCLMSYTNKKILIVKLNYEKVFSKTEQHMNFSQNMFTKEFLLSGNRLPVSKMIFKKLSTEFTTFQLISKCCNRLQCFGNRLPMCLNVGVQI